MAPTNASWWLGDRPPGRRAVSRSHPRILREQQQRHAGGEYEADADDAPPVCCICLSMRTAKGRGQGEGLHGPSRFEPEEMADDDPHPRDLRNREIDEDDTPFENLC